MSEKEIQEDRKVTILNWAPREGKTHTALEWIFEKNKSFVSLVPNHDLAEHQTKEVMQKFDGNLAVGHLVGKNKSCIAKDKRRCKNCQYRGKSYNHSDEVFKGVIEKKRCSGFVIDASYLENEFPNECPYHLLKQISNFADGVVTVPQLFSKVQTRDVLLIDEEVTLNHFYPQSALVAHFQQRFGETQTKSHLMSITSQLKEIKEMIFEEMDKEVVSASKYTVVKEAIDKLINIIEYSENNELDIDRFIAFLRKIDWNIDKEGVSDEEIAEFVQKCAVKVQKHSNLEIDDLLLSVIWKKEIYKQSASRRGSKIYLIGDHEKLFYQSKIENFDKVILIGDLEAKKSAKKITNNSSEIQTNNKKDFKYKRNFFILSVRGKGKNDLKSQQEIIINLAQRLAQMESKFLIFAGSKRKANEIRNNEELARRIITDGADKKGDIEDFIHSNLGIIAYLNSRLTRGVDLPDLHITLIHSAGFSQPQYESLKENHTDEQGKKGTKFLDYTLSSEITNAVMRISPVHGEKENYPKIVVIPEYYSDRIDYLAPPIRVSEEEAFRVLRQAKKITDSYEEKEKTTQSSSERKKSGSHLHKGNGVKNPIKEMKKKTPEKIFRGNIEDFREIRNEVMSILRSKKEMKSSRLREKLKKSVSTNDNALISQALSLLFKLCYLSKRKEGRKRYWRLNDDYT